VNETTIFVPECLHCINLLDETKDAIDDPLAERVPIFLVCAGLAK
jgi:hypothetical protein